jgi:DNA-binding NtrC family response regulator
MKPRLLLVDDEPNVTDGIKRALRDEEYEISTASSAGEALTLMSSQPFDILVTDDMMASMRGSEMLQYVKDEQPHIVSILLTGQATLRSAKRAVNEGGAFKVLEKPAQRTDLILILREAVEYSKVKRSGLEANDAEDPATILVADEDDTSRQILKTMFEHEGYTVREAPNDAEALFQAHTDGLDSAALNLQIKGTEGLNVIKEFAKGAVPVVLVSVPARIFPESAQEIHPRLTYLHEPVEFKDVVRETLALLEPAEKSKAS